MGAPHALLSGDRFVSASVAILNAARAGSPSRQDVTLVASLSDGSGRRIAARIFWADDRFTRQFEHDDIIAGGDWSTSIDACTPHGYLRAVAERLPLTNYARDLLGAVTEAYRLCHPDSHYFTFVRAAVDANGVTRPSTRGLTLFSCPAGLWVTLLIVPSPHSRLLIIVPSF
jgi:hypothetical protein